MFKSRSVASTFLLLLMPLTITSHTLASMANTNTSPFLFPTWEEIRWQQIVRQDNLNDCGPAAVATLLQLLSQDQIASIPEVDAYTSLAQLQALLAANQLPSSGLYMPFDGLLRYLNDFHIPLIAHIMIPSPHFTVVSAAQAERIITYDPALGHTSWEYAEWQSIWTGITLVLWPPPSSGCFTHDASIEERIKLLTRIHWQGGI